MDGKNGKGGKGEKGKGEESMTTMMGGKDEMMQEMMDEKEGLCLSNDQVWFLNCKIVETSTDKCLRCT